MNFQKNIKTIELIIFYRQLATLLSAGVSSLQCLEIVYSCQQNLNFRKIIISIKKEIATGHSFSYAFSQFQAFFDVYTCYLIKMGEMSGTLPDVLKKIALQIEKTNQLSNQFKQALIYPAVISVTAFLISLIMIMFIIPQFAQIYTQQSIPLPTQLLIQFSFIIRQLFMPCISVFLILILVFSYLHLKNIYRINIKELLLKIPIIGLYGHKMILINLLSHLSTTYSAGIPVSDAIKYLIPVSPYKRYSRALFNLHKSIANGQQFHVALQNDTLFPALIIKMVKVGEESGTLEQMLEKTIEIYSYQIEIFLHTVRQLLEPLIMIVLGVLIGGLVIIMYMPIFKLGSAI